MGMGLEVVYVGNDDSRQSASLGLRLRSAGARASRTVRLRGCADGCQLVEMSVRRIYGEGTNVFNLDPEPFVVLLERVAVGDRDLTDLAWRPDEGSISANENNRFFDDLVDPLRRITANRRDGLEVAPLPEGPTALVLTASGLPVRLLSADLEDPVPLDLGSSERPADPLGSYAALPLRRLGRRADRPHRVLGRRRVPRCRAPSPAIVVAADTPDELLDRLVAATGTEPRSLEDVRRARSAPPPAPTRPAPTS